MGKKRKQADHKADTRGGQWAGIPHKVLDSEAYLDLSLWARAILTEIVRKMNGYNNGNIAVSYVYLIKRLGNTNKRKIGAAIAQLMDHGFLETKADADWKGRRSREYRLTFVNTTPGDKHKAATNDYTNWVNPKQKAGNASSPLKHINGDAVSPFAKKNGDAVSLAKFAKLRKTPPKLENGPSKNGDDASPLIYKPYPPTQSKAAKDDDGLIELSKNPGDDFGNINSFDKAMRDCISSAWRNMDARCRLEFSARHKVREHEINSYLNGSDCLPVPKLMAIRSDVASQ